jgi:hypothetical protein
MLSALKRRPPGCVAIEVRPSSVTILAARFAWLALPIGQRCGEAGVDASKGRAAILRHISRKKWPPISQSFLM